MVMVNFVVNTLGDCLMLKLVHCITVLVRVSWLKS